VDTAFYIPKYFSHKVKQVIDVFSIAEVSLGPIPLEDFNIVSDYQAYFDSMLNYPLYYELRKVFGYNDGITKKVKYYPMSLLSRYKTFSERYLEIDYIGNFADNHDQGRFLNYQSDVALFKSYIVFSLCEEGIPIFYAGGELGFNGEEWKGENREIM